MKNKNLAWLLAGVAMAVSSGTLSAQTLQVSGQVTDTNGLPLQDVTVTTGGTSAQTNPGGIYELSFDNNAQQRVQISFSKDGYANTFGIVTPPTAPPVTDSDGDGVDDNIDQCPASDSSDTVVIGDRDTGVANAIDADGCTAMDTILLCSDQAEEKYQALLEKTGERRHRHEAHHTINSRKAKGYRKAKFVQCVVRALRPHRHHTGLISHRDLGKIIRATAHADLPLAHDGGSGTSGGTEPTTVSMVLNKAMIAIGGSREVDPVNGGTATVNGFSVEFPVGAFATNGTTNPVEIFITPIDVTTSQIKAFPGDFEADDKDGNRVTLETFSLMKVDLLQNGNPVSLNNGKSATVTFLLPENTALQKGETVPLWYYDEATGIWKQDGSVSIDESLSFPGRLVATGDVSHFTWWNVDHPISEQTSLSGRVIDLNGNPVDGAAIYAYGKDYSGISYATTDANGSYCINVKLQSSVEVEAQQKVGGFMLSETSDSIATSNENVRCEDGGSSQTIADLVLHGTSCISGVVLDANSIPISGDQVITRGGGYATTDATGHYCVTAAAETTSIVWSSTNANSIEVTTSGEASCADDNCALAPPLLPSPVSGAETRCVTAAVSSATPNLSASIWDYYAGDIQVSGNATVASDGTFCLNIQPETGPLFDLRFTDLDNSYRDCSQFIDQTIPATSGASCSMPTSCTDLGSVSVSCGGGNQSQY